MSRFSRFAHDGMLAGATTLCVWAGIASPLRRGVGTRARAGHCGQHENQGEPDAPEVYSQLAMAYGRKGDVAEADLASAQAALARGDAELDRRPALGRHHEALVSLPQLGEDRAVPPGGLPRLPGMGGGFPGLPGLGRSSRAAWTALPTPPSTPSDAPGRSA